MIAASWPRSNAEEDRLLHVDARTARVTDGTVKDLPSLLLPGDSLVLNDAATLPAAFHVEDGSIEVRLVMRLGSDREWRALLFGPGSFRSRTEHRADPPRVRVGASLDFGDGFCATVVGVDREFARVVDIQFSREGAALWQAIFRHGRPVQYAHVSAPLSLWHVQSHFAARPWALELPSAGRPLTWGILTDLRRRGVEIASITHAAGLSSTGSVALDGTLPMPERYEVTEAARLAVTRTKARGGRVIAAGTTVVRALEASALANGGVLAAGVGVANLLIGPGFTPRIVDGILSGIHPPGSSHFALLRAFASQSLLERARSYAEARGYLEHEFGDSCLVLPSHDSVPPAPPPR
jgi:S-adenosylmethionine:tRNA ribosyltransferase-isomerase